MDIMTNAVWDRLVGGLMIYVDNFFIAKQGGGRYKLSPSYEVDYNISDEIIKYIEENVQECGIENLWYNKIAAYKNVNNIPSPLRELVVQYLPRFIAQYPKYKDAPSLRLDE